MRLIDADAFREEMIGVGYDWESVLDMMPTIDAVEVVRCKECKRWTDMGEPWGECRWSELGNITLATTPDDYCSNGVRK